MMWFKSKGKSQSSKMWKKFMDYHYTTQFWCTPCNCKTAKRNQTHPQEDKIEANGEITENKELKIGFRGCVYGIFFNTELTLKNLQLIIK